MYLFNWQDSDKQNIIFETLYFKQKNKNTHIMI